MNTHNHPNYDSLASLQEVMRRIRLIHGSNHKKAEELVMEVLNAPKSIINIDANDICELFQGEEEILLLEISVNEMSEMRMEQLMEVIEKEVAHLEYFNQLLMYFFVPQDFPLTMDELNTFLDYTNLNYGLSEVIWGSVFVPTQQPAIRAIMMLQHGVSES